LRVFDFGYRFSYNSQKELRNDNHVFLYNLVLGTEATIRLVELLRLLFHLVLTIHPIVRPELDYEVSIQTDEAIRLNPNPPSIVSLSISA